MKVLLLLLVLFAGIACDNVVTVSCKQCNAVACLTYTGGPFKGQTYPTQSSSCAKAGNFPIVTDFQCVTSCTSGCQLYITAPNQPAGTICSNTPAAQVTINSYNMLYSAIIGDSSLTSKYDWCNCKKTAGLTTEQ
jgi:hypothetical protein